MATIGTNGMAMVFNGLQPLVKRWDGSDPSLWSIVSCVKLCGWEEFHELCLVNYLHVACSQRKIISWPPGTFICMDQLMRAVEAGGKVGRNIF